MRIYRNRAIPMLAIRIPETWFINRNVSELMHARTEPREPHRNIHHAVEPQKIPATNSIEETSDAPGKTIPKPGRIATKNSSVRGFAMAMATIET